MSKVKKDMLKSVMKEIKSGQIKMKPRWVFVVGTAALISGVVGIYVLSVFLVSLISFSLRTHGPMGEIRYQELLSNFPFWAVGLVLLGLIVGVMMLKKFDFSYKRNFVWIVLAFVLSTVIGGWLVDYTGLDNTWSGQGQMKRIYQRYDGRGKVLPWNSDNSTINVRGNGQGRGYGYNGY